MSPFIHPTAIIDPAATIHDSARIGAYTVVEGPVRVNADVQVGPHVHLLGITEIGAGSRVHAGAVIGDVPQDHAYAGAESFCRLGQGCIIREHSTIHRGTQPGSGTILGNRCFVMAGAHVAHNCRLADDVILANAALLAGFVAVEARAFISGGVVVHQFVRIGECSMIHGGSQVGKDVPPFMMTDVFGYVAGINAVGLDRGGYSANERAEVKQAHRALYRGHEGFGHAVEALAKTLRSEAGHRLLTFLRAPSRRGIAPRTRRFREPAFSDIENLNHDRCT